MASRYFKESSSRGRKTLIKNSSMRACAFAVLNKPIIVPRPGRYTKSHNIHDMFSTNCRLFIFPRRKGVCIKNEQLIKKEFCKSRYGTRTHNCQSHCDL